MVPLEENTNFELRLHSKYPLFLLMGGFRIISLTSQSESLGGSTLVLNPLCSDHSLRPTGHEWNQNETQAIFMLQSCNIFPLLASGAMSAPHTAILFHVVLVTATECSKSGKLVILSGGSYTERDETRSEVSSDM